MTLDTTLAEYIHDHIKDASEDQRREKDWMKKELNKKERNGKEEGKGEELIREKWRDEVTFHG